MFQCVLGYETLLWPQAERTLLSADAFGPYDTAELGQEPQIPHACLTVRCSHHCYGAGYHLLLLATGFASHFHGEGFCWLEAVATLFWDCHICL